MSSSTLVLRNRATKAQVRHAKSGSFAAPLSQVEFAMRHQRRQQGTPAGGGGGSCMAGPFSQAPPEVAYDRVIERIAINSGPSGLFLNPPGFFDLRPTHTS
jgi:hypothetical protein